MPKVKLRSSADSSAAPVMSASFGGIRLDQLLAAVALLAIGLRIEIAAGLTVDTAISVALAPVWLPALARFRGARILLALGFAALVFGLLLSRLAYPAYQINTSQRTGYTMLLFGILCAIGVGLWARTVVSAQAVVVIYGIGMLLRSASGGIDPQGNPWKFVYALPVAIVVLGLASRRWAQVAALVGLALACIALDSRSYFATCLLALVLVLWQMRPRDLSGRASTAATAGFMALVAGAVYYLGTTLLESGALGEELRQRSAIQSQSAGSLLLGGRPEIAATVDLMSIKPWGFGVGVIARLSEINSAKSAMSEINYDPNNGYVDKFMFGGRIELHSVLGDLWVSWGVVGLAFGVAIGYFIVKGLAAGVAQRTATGTMVFVSAWSLWNLFFSPLMASQPSLIITVIVVMLVRPLPTRAVGDYPIRRYSRRVTPKAPASSPA